MDVISKGFTLHKSSYWICKILQHVEKLTQLVLMRFYSLLKCESSENMSIAYVLPWKQTSDVMSLLWCGKDITSLSLVWDQGRWRAGGLKNIIHGPYKLHIKNILL